MTPQKISENKGWQDFLDRFGESAGEEIMDPDLKLLMSAAFREGKNTALELTQSN